MSDPLGETGERLVAGGKAAVRAVCPATAAWLNAMVKAFGRPAAVRVTADDGRVVYEFGQFDDERARATEADDDDGEGWMR